MLKVHELESSSITNINIRLVHFPKLPNLVIEGQTSVCDDLSPFGAEDPEKLIKEESQFYLAEFAISVHSTVLSKHPCTAFQGINVAVCT